MRTVAIRSDLYFEDKDTFLLIPDCVCLDEEYKKMNNLEHSFSEKYPKNTALAFIA